MQKSLLTHGCHFEGANVIGYNGMKVLAWCRCVDPLMKTPISHNTALAQLASIKLQTHCGVTQIKQTQQDVPHWIFQPLIQLL